MAWKEVCSPALLETESSNSLPWCPMTWSSRIWNGISLRLCVILSINKTTMQRQVDVKTTVPPAGEPARHVWLRVAVSDQRGLSLDFDGSELKLLHKHSPAQGHVRCPIAPLCAGSCVCGTSAGLPGWGQAALEEKKAYFYCVHGNLSEQKL